MAQTQSIRAGELHTAMERLAAAIGAAHRTTPRLVVLGIANGGIELSRRLHPLIAREVKTLSPKPGILDISFHRDDFGRNPIPKEFTPTLIPADVNGATVVLVDDVLFSGRTVKAALDELFDHGRPTKVELAILVDRGGRRLPIAADYCGLTLPVGENERVIVRLDAADPQRDEVRVESANRSRQSPA